MQTATAAGPAAPLQIHPVGGRHDPYPYPHLLGGSGPGGHHHRLHGSEYCTWHGVEHAVDEAGRRWTRNYDAVIDDFGTLVEVPA